LLGDHIRAATFHDAAKSWQDNALIGPPTLEFAPYPKLPGGRRRNDPRQGTIDQDQEFKDFLESLTNPIAKAAAPESDGQKHEKAKTTPLIEALREKKANREKPNTKTTRQPRPDGKEDADKKPLAKSGKENALTAGDKNRRITKADRTQAAKDAVRILNKEASSSKDTAAPAPNDKATAGPTPERKRGNVAEAKSILQRDLLGIGAPTRRRGTKREVVPSAPEANVQSKDTPAAEQKLKEAPAPAAASAAERAAQAQKKERPTRAERRAFKASLTDKSNEKTPANETKAQTPPKPAAAAPQILKKPQTTPATTTPKGPAASRPPPSEPAAARNAASPAQSQRTAVKPVAAPAAPVVHSNVRPAPANPVPAPTSKQAFLKHANPSQGITEPLIEEALKAFGSIDKVEIDKRKGFAYVDFTEPDGLQKAMAASPIKIAQGAVQVLERKEKVTRPVNPRFNGPPPTGPARGGMGGRGGVAPRGRGGRGGARGGHVVSNPSPAVSSSESALSAVVAPPAAAPPAPTPAPSAEVAT
jgi:regulator of nonsense transcripts 3